MADIPLPQFDDRIVFDLYASKTLFRILEITLRIQLFEELGTPCEIDRLPGVLNIGERAIRILLPVLAATGLVAISSGSACLTSLAKEYFLKDSPYFKGTLFRTIPDNEFDLIRNVHLQDGLHRPLTERWLAGTASEPDMQAEVMRAHTFAAAMVFARHSIFKSFRHVLDVGGGAGSTSVALAQQNRELRCTVMDLPAMEGVARSLIERSGVKQKVTFFGANMFKSQWPGNCDAVLFSNIFHDWDWERCRALAEKAFRSLSSGGRIFLSEMLLDEGRNGPLGVALFSAMMLLMTEGSQFTATELKGLLLDAGFQDWEQLSCFGYYTLVTARKV